MDGPMMVYAGFLVSAVLILSVTIYMIIKRSPRKPDNSESHE
jgi:hypothetical protein